MEKQTIRNAVSVARLENKVQHMALSDIITKKLLMSTAFLGSQTYFIYVGTDMEVQTKNLIYALLDKGKRVFAPRTERDGIVVVEVTAQTEFVRGAYGIEEPIGARYYGDIDIAIVPLIAFDEECNRVGHGKGCYDAYLQTFEGYKLALSFEYQKVDEIDVEVYDVPMDAILTEKNSYARFKRPKL